MNSPNLIESVTPCSGRYSFRQDLRLNAWFLVATVVYLLGRYALRENPAWSPWTRSLVGLTPLLPGLLYLRTWVRFVRGLDELQRRMQVEAHIFAAWGTLVAGMVVTMLNQEGAVTLLPRGLGFGGVVVVFFPLWLVGTALANHRYR
jgi:hypothetical protein